MPDEKIPSRFSEDVDSEPPPPAWFETERPAWFEMQREETLRRLKAEDDLTIRQFALDMAVTALPNLITGVEGLDWRLEIIQRAAAEFEKILRGDAVV